MMDSIMKLSLLKGSYTLSIPPLASILIAMLWVMLIQLGLWQQHRAQWKTHYLQQQQTQAAQPPITLTKALSRSSQPQEFLALELQGYFDNEHTLLLDNRYRHHQPGFEVLTPFLDESSHHWILVNRGWLPSTPTHTLERPVLPITGHQTLLGHVHTPSKKGVIIGNNIVDTHPLIIQQVHLLELNQVLNRTFLPFTLRLSSAIQPHYDVVWPTVALSPARHQAYAFQWYALAVALLVCFFALNIKRND